MLDDGRTQALANINSKPPMVEAPEEGLTRLYLKYSKSLRGFQRKFTILRTQEYVESVEIVPNKSGGLPEHTRDLKSGEDGGSGPKL